MSKKQGASAKKLVQARLDPPIYRGLKNLAAEDGRSLKNFVERVLIQYVASAAAPKAG